jgi:hypothetical protein
VDTSKAFMKNMKNMKNMENQGNERKVFDWDKAAKLIKKTNPSKASAGLSGDWEWTGGPICINGSPVNADDTYTYLASTWATPELEMDGIVCDCFKMESETDGWDAGTYWPASALEILQAENN